MYDHKFRAQWNYPEPWNLELFFVLTSFSGWPRIFHRAKKCFCEGKATRDKSTHANVLKTKFNFPQGLSLLRRIGLPRKRLFEGTTFNEKFLPLCVFPLPDFVLLSVGCHYCICPGSSPSTSCSRQTKQFFFLKLTPFSFNEYNSTCTHKSGPSNWESERAGHPWAVNCRPQYLKH